MNPIGLVYLTNMRHASVERSVSTLYHAWFIDGSKGFDSKKTSRFGPVPGLMIGGPNEGYERGDCYRDVCGGFGDRICPVPTLLRPWANRQQNLTVSLMRAGLAGLSERLYPVAEQIHTINIHIKKILYASLLGRDSLSMWSISRAY